ncbi:MAG: EF-P lysine aminoacylase GenX [Deltaproteobacteria bacterium]|nr:EF-P lysine aminoacylase GenX [Deltaproteobacteria bacterium]
MEALSPEGLARRAPALRARADVLRALRLFLERAGYLEVETPHRIPAPAPELHIDAVPSGPWYLHTSPELAMKRLLAAGYSRLFQVSRCFRAGERGRTHLPEFTLLEWYRAGADYGDLMEETEALLRSVAAALGVETLAWRGHRVSLDGPWEKVTVREAFRRHAGTSPEEALARGVFEEVLVERVEPHLGFGAPAFLYDYPVRLGALARRKSEDPSLAERFELYAAGLELANGFSELTDAREQRERFTEEREERARAGKDPYPMPECFLHDLERMPEAAGIALGVDRLVMLLVGAGEIDEVVAFTPEEL